MVICAAVVILKIAMPPLAIDSSAALNQSSRLFMHLQFHVITHLPRLPLVLCMYNEQQAGTAKYGRESMSFS